MSQELFNTDWGDWRLGDLPAVVQQAAEMLSPSRPFAAVEMRPPEPGTLLPIVRVVAPKVEDSIRMRSSVEQCEFFADFDPSPTVNRWACTAGGLRLRVDVEGTQP